MMHLLPALLAAPSAAVAAAPEAVIPPLAWLAATAGLWLRLHLPADPQAEEAAAAAIIGYGVM